MGRKAGSHAQTTGPLVRATALRLFAQYGYAAVSMRQIAAEVGVQAGALYSYTPDKQALLFDLLREHMSEVLAAWSRCEKRPEPVARLEDFVRFHIRHHIVRSEGVFLSYMELRNLSAAHFEKIQHLRRSYEDALEDILKSGQAAGVFKVTDTRIATMAVIAMLTGVNTWFREDGRLSPDEVADVYWQMVRQSVGA